MLRHQQSSFTVTHTRRVPAPIPNAPRARPSGLAVLRSMPHVRHHRAEQHERFVARFEDEAARIAERDRRIAIRILLAEAARHDLRRLAGMPAGAAPLPPELRGFCRAEWRRFMAAGEACLNTGAHELFGQNAHHAPGASPPTSQVALEIISSLGVWFTGPRLSIPFRTPDPEDSSSGASCGAPPFRYSTYVMSRRLEAQQALLQEVELRGAATTAAVAETTTVDDDHAAAAPCLTGFGDEEDDELGGAALPPWEDDDEAFAGLVSFQEEEEEAEETETCRGNASPLQLLRPALEDDDSSRPGSPSGGSPLSRPLTADSDASASTVGDRHPHPHPPPQWLLTALALDDVEYCSGVDGDGHPFFSLALHDRDAQGRRVLYTNVVVGWGEEEDAEDDDARDAAGEAHCRFFRNISPLLGFAP